MTPEQLELLAQYRDLWGDLNSALSMRAALDDHIRGIKEQQRRLASKLAAMGDPEHREGK